jgi:hypothetical protein
MMMMHSNFLQSEFRQVYSKNDEANQYLLRMINQCGPIRNQQKLLVCFMNLDCKNELVKYTKCLI